MEAVFETNLPGLPVTRGKVRDIYDLGDRLLIVATDRVSAFDVVLPDPIPEKGKILTGLSAFWFRLVKKEFPNHLISTTVEEYPPEIQTYKELLTGRSMLVKKGEVIPVECVVRGYLAGAGWNNYQKTGMLYGLPLPPDLKEGEKLPAPVFTPTTKAEEGHDRPLSFSELQKITGWELAEKLQKLSLDLYRRGAQKAEEAGIIIADTKFEFAWVKGELLLVDEIFTPDSSRFWPADQYVPGRSQPSFDKQYIRDYLTSLGWDYTPPAPSLPPTVIEATRRKYYEAYRRLTGTSL